MALRRPLRPHSLECAQDVGRPGRVIRNDEIVVGHAVPHGDRLALDYFGMHRFDDGLEIFFQLSYGDWIRLFRANGLVVEDLVEPHPGTDATSSYRDGEALAWARRWPSENIWRLRRS